MNINRVNNLLEEVRARLQSLDEGIERMDPESHGSISSANDRVGALLAKLTHGRSKHNMIHAAGTRRR